MQVDGDQPKQPEVVDVKDGEHTSPPVEDTELTGPDIIATLDTISQAVQQFDTRFILRALRAVPNIRKRLGSPSAARDTINAVKERRASNQDQKTKKNKTEAAGLLPEEETYLALLEQVRRSC